MAIADDTREEGGIRALLQKNTPIVLGVLAVLILVALWW